MNERIGIDSTRLKWRQEEADPEEAKEWFLERAELLGCDKPKKYRGELHVNLYSPNGAGDFPLRFSYLGGNTFSLEGSMGCFHEGSKGANLLSIEDIHKVLGLLVNMLSLDLRFTKVETLEVAKDCLLVAPYNDYLHAFRTPTRMNLIKDKGTLYYHPKSNAKRKRYRKQFKVYNKGAELGIQPITGCLMRIELTLCGGASMIGQTLKAGRPLMAIDLQDETIQSTLVKQFAEMIHDIIKGQANERKVRGGKDAILEEMALELIEAGINPLELAERAIQRVQAKNKRMARKRITKQLEDIINAKRDDRAKELRESFGSGTEV